MNDIERISKETAARLVTTQDYPSGTRFEVLIGGIMASVASWRQPADEQVAQFRHAIAAEIEVALRTPPGDSPLSAERLEEARKRDALMRAYSPPGVDPDWSGFQPESRQAFRDRAALLAAFDHQARLIRWLMGEPEGEDVEALLRQARLAGRAEQKAADLEALRPVIADVKPSQAAWIVSAVVNAEVTDDG